jgi:hypothetical protein
LGASALTLLYAIFLFAQGETGPAVLIVIVGFVAVSSCFAERVGEGRRQASFILVAVLGIASCFLISVTFAVSQNAYEWIGLGVVACAVSLATLTEGAYAIRASRTREARADRFALVACIVIVVAASGFLLKAALV